MRCLPIFLTGLMEKNVCKEDIFQAKAMSKPGISRSLVTISRCDLPGVSLGVAVGVGLGVGLGLSAALSGIFAAVGLVQFTVANAQEFINNPNVQPLGSIGSMLVWQ